MATSASEELITEPSASDNFYICCSCKTPFDDRDHQPKYLPCLHSVCKQCLREKVDPETTQVDCPTCGRTVNLPVKGSFLLIPDNYLVENLKIYREVFKSSSSDTPKDGAEATTGRGHVKCANCAEDKPGENFCKDCGNFLCDSCAGYHGKIRQFRSHKVLKIDDLPKMNVNPLKCHKICQRHTMEYLTLYCKSRNCEKAVCSTCALLDHDKTKGHKLVQLDEIASKVTSDLQDLADVVRDKEQKLQEVCHSFDTVTKIMQANCATREADMRDIVARLHQAIDERFDEANMKMHQVCDAQANHLAKRKQRMEAIRCNFTSALEFTENALEASHPDQLLSSRRHISKRFDELKAGDVPEKENYQVTYIYQSIHQPAVESIESSVGNLFRIYQHPPAPPNLLVTSPEQKNRSESVGSPTESRTFELRRERASSNPTDPIGKPTHKVRRAPPPPRPVTKTSSLDRGKSPPSLAEEKAEKRRMSPPPRRQLLKTKATPHHHANQKKHLPLTTSTPLRPPPPTSAALINRREKLVTVHPRHEEEPTPSTTEKKTTPKKRAKSFDGILDDHHSDENGNHIDMMTPPPKPCRDTKVLGLEKEMTPVAIEETGGVDKQKKKKPGLPPKPTSIDHDETPAPSSEETAPKVDEKSDEPEHTTTRENTPSSSSVGDNVVPDPTVEDKTSPEDVTKTSGNRKKRQPPPVPPVKRSTEWPTTIDDDDDTEL